MWRWILVMAGLACLSCGGTHPKAIHSGQTQVQLVARNYEIVRYGLRAEACKTTVFGFGQDDISYARVMGLLHKQVSRKSGREYQFINIVEDTTFNFFLLGSKRCTILSADLAVLKEPMPVQMIVQPRLEDSSAPSEPSDSEEAAPEPRQIVPSDVSLLVCDKFKACDSARFESTHRSIEECKVAFNKRTFLKPVCPSFDAAAAKQCMDATAALECGVFLQILQRGEGYPEECNGMCGK